jgi:hypothetical protein
MRFALCVAGLLCASQAGAVTVIQGQSLDGNLNLGDFSSSFTGSGKTRVSLKIEGAVFQNAKTSVATAYSWSEFLPGNSTDQGNDSFIDESCDFGGTCGLMGNPAWPTRFLSEFFSDATNISFTVTTPQAYDNCPALGVCAESWKVGYASIEGYTSGRKPFSYTLTLADNAVPEPASWAMMLAGFGAIGAMARSPSTRNRSARFQNSR